MLPGDGIKILKKKCLYFRKFLKPSLVFLADATLNHRNHTSRSRIVVFSRRDKCKKLSAFALPQKLVWQSTLLVWSVVMGCAG
jgi:hypothetical protein